jgi:hypothetical protein
MTKGILEHTYVSPRSPETEHSWSIVARKDWSKEVLHQSLMEKTWTSQKGSHQRLD